MAVTNDEIILDIASPVRLMACRKCGQTIDTSGLPLFQVVQCPVCQASQKVPAELKHFLLFDVLGRGGMAVVYRALDRTLNRQVAIKVMLSSLETDPQFVANFLREACAAAQINHPNIVQIYMVDEAGGHPFIVMELLDGGRLDDMIAAGRPLAEEFLLRAGLQAAEGLAAAADRGLIHGDVKPANILFDRAGTAKLTDFGLARFQQKPLQQGEIWGTPYYIAPEKVRERREDYRSDIYSLGATLFHAFALTPPFEGKTATDVVLARLKGPPPSLEEFRADLHLATQQLIRRMLEPDPMVRYPTYVSLISDMRSTLEQVQKGPAPAVSPPSPRRRRRWILAVAGVVVVVGVAGAVWWAARRPPPSTSAPAPPTPPPPAPATNVVAAAPPAQPFSDAEQQRLVEAFAALARHDVARYESTLVDMARGAPSRHSGRAWIALFLAIPPWIEGQPAETTRRLSKLMEARYDKLPDGSAHPSALPQSLARLVLGQPYLPPPSDRPLPEWYESLRRLFSVSSATAAGQLDEAAGHVGAYLSAPANVPPWTRSLAPIAEVLKARIAEWKAFRDAVDGRITRGEGDQVLKELRDREKDRAWALFKTDIRQRISSAERKFQEWKKAEERKQREAAEAQRKAEEEAQRRRQEEEIAAGREFSAGLPAFFAQRNFRGASEAAKALQGRMTTPAGREAAKFWVDALAAVEGLTDHVAAAIKGAPYRGPAARRDFGGDVIAVSSSGALVLLAGGAGTAERAWRNVSARAFFDLCRQYIPPEGDPRRGRVALALALYAWASPELRPLAPRAAELAIKADPAAEAPLRAHLPDLLPAAP